MRPIVNGLKETYGTQIDFMTIDYNSEHGREKARQYGVTGHPTFVALDRTGSVKQKLIGDNTRERMEQVLKEILN